MTDPKPPRAGWAIEPVGSSQTGWALVYNGRIKASLPSAFVLGAYLDTNAMLGSSPTRWRNADGRRLTNADGGPQPSPQAFKKG